MIRGFELHAAFQFADHGMGYCAGGTGSSEEGAYLGIFCQHLLTAHRVFDQVAYLGHKGVCIAVVLNELLERKTVHYQVSQTYVLDLDNLLGDPVGEGIGYVSYYLRGVEQGGLQGSGSGIYHSCFSMTEECSIRRTA